MCCMLHQRCTLPMLSSSTESITSYGPLDVGVDPSPRFRWSDNVDIPYWGQFALYAGSGFVYDLPLNLTDARAQWLQLKQDQWIDEHTRLVLLDWNMYNAGKVMSYV